MHSARRFGKNAGQGAVETLLVLAVIALAAVGVSLWKPALGGYLERLAKVLTQVR